MAAKNDCEAVLAWVKAQRGLSEAQRAALKRKRAADPEAERFMLWAVVQHNKPLSSMTRDDCEAYRAFLANPHR